LSLGLDTARSLDATVKPLCATFDVFLATNADRIDLSSIQSLTGDARAHAALPVRFAELCLDDELVMVWRETGPHLLPLQQHRQQQQLVHRGWKSGCQRLGQMQRLASLEDVGSGNVHSKIIHIMLGTKDDTRGRDGELL
jgi:hypothetical protein